MAGHSSAGVMHDASVAGGVEASERLPFAMDGEGLGEEGGATEGQPYAVVSFGAPFSILDANDDWCEMVGFAKAKIVGRTLRMLQGPRTNVGSLKEIVHSCQQGVAATGIITFYSQSGNELLCAVTARVHPFDDEEKDDACRLTMCKTEASIFCMASFSSEMQPQVVISLPAQEVLHVNPAFNRRFTSVESVIGKNISELHSAKSASAWKRMVHACCSGVSVRLHMVVSELPHTEFECMVRAVPRLADDSSEVHRILLTYEVEPTERGSLDGPGLPELSKARSKTFSGDELLNLGKTQAEMEEIEFLQLVARTPSVLLSKSQPDWMNSPMRGIARDRTERKLASHLNKMQSIMGNPPSEQSSIAGSFSNKVNTATIVLGSEKSTLHAQSGGREQARAGVSSQNIEPLKSGMDRARSMSANTSPNLISASCSEVVVSMNGSSNAGIESKDKAQRATMKTDRGLQRHLQLMASRRPSAASSFSSAKASSPAASTDSNSRSVDSREGSAAGSTSGSSSRSTLHSQKDESLCNTSEPSLNQKVMAVMKNASLNGSQRHQMIQELRRQHADGKASKVQDFTAPSHPMTASRDAPLTVPESVAEEGVCTPLSAIFPPKNRPNGGQDIVNLTSPSRRAMVPSVEDELKAAACKPLDDMLGDGGGDGSQWQGVRPAGSHLLEAGMEDNSLCHWRGMGKVETFGSFSNKIQSDISGTNIGKRGGDHEGQQQTVESLLLLRRSFDKPKHDAEEVSRNVASDEARTTSCESRTSSNDSVLSSCSSESRAKAEKTLNKIKIQRRREEMHVDAAIERCGGDKEGVYQMAIQFLQEDFPSKVASLRRAVEMNDLQAAAEIAASMIDLAEAIGAVSLLERLEPLASFKPAAARSQGNASRTQSFDSKVDLIGVEIERVERFWRNYDPT